LNTRTHSGHIYGTRDVWRRLATPSDTQLPRRDHDRSIDEIPAKG
jgi:hypothetical protein